MRNIWLWGLVSVLSVALVGGMQRPADSQEADDAVIWRGAISAEGVTTDPHPILPRDNDQPWAAKMPSEGPEQPYSCRIVSYAGKWTRHGFGNYMVWRYPNGPLAQRPADSEVYHLSQDVDVDGDGKTSDDYVAALSYSLDVPLSNPDWPFHAAFPGRYSSRFYGGVSWLVGNAAPFGDGGRISRFWVEMGYNPDHSPPWYDPRAEDHPLQGQADERNPDSVVKTFFVILWKKDDFLNGGDRYRVSFDDNSRLASITARDYWLGYNDVRILAQDGKKMFISDNKTFDIPKKGYGRSRGRVFLVNPTEVTWARYEPRGHQLGFDAAAAEFMRHDFQDVQAVGWYLAKDTLEGKQAHLKWYGFEADAVVHRPEQGSVNLEMAEVAETPGLPAFWMSTCEVPYALWRHVVRWGDAPFHTLQARYVYSKDGDMGSMSFGDKPHYQDEPATNMTFYDALAWCNTLSELEGKEPCYYVDAEYTEPFRNMHIATRSKAPSYDDRNRANPTIETVPEPIIYVNWGATGHRLPTPAEWAAAYGSADVNAGWTRDAGAGTHEVGLKPSNPAGMHDMLGNVWELVWTYGDAFDPQTHETATAMGGDYMHPLDPRSADAAASPYGDTPWDGNHNVGLRTVCRGAGLPAPLAGTDLPAPGYAAAGAPRWTFGRNARTAARLDAVPIEEPVLETVPLPAGRFLRRPDETAITVSAFRIAKYQTTYVAWKRVVHWADARGYTFGRSGDMGSMFFYRFPHRPSEPVTRVTWHDMVVWCNALSEMEGRTPCYYTDEALTAVYRHAFTWKPLKVSGQEMVREGGHRYSEYSSQVTQPWLFMRWDADGYRLPTAAEFEYALRGGTDSPFPFDGDPDDYVWSVRNAGGRTHQVGQKKPNGFGLYDMQGNVFHWVNSMAGHPATRPAELDTANPKQDIYWSWQQPREIYSPRSNALMLGASWLCGDVNINGQHGVMANPQNSANTVMYYADLGFRVVRCEEGTHPRDGKEPLGEWPTVIRIDPENYNPLQR